MSSTEREALVELTDIISLICNKLARDMEHGEKWGKRAQRATEIGTLFKNVAS